MFNKLCVVGLGYIGLPTAVMFANNGIKVHGVDVSEKVVNSINNKIVHIEENGLEERLNKAINEGKFTVSTKPRTCRCIYYCCPSPINPEKKVNLDYSKDATRSILPYLRKGNLVILESTVPPRTVEDIMLPILKESSWKLALNCL